MSIRKIAHISDVHLMKTPIRNDEYRSVFDRLYSSLNKNKPDLIIITGDLMNDYIDLQGEQVVLASEFLNNLSKIALVRVIRGNHDYHRARPNRTDSIEAIVKAINNDRILYLNKTGLIEDNNIVWAVWKYGDKHSPWGLGTYQKDPSKTYIDLYHDTINGAVNPNGLVSTGGNLIKLDGFNGEYVFAGHIHKQQFLNKEKTIAYAGSLIAQDFTEGDDNFHGYLLWDIENKKVEPIEIKNDYSFKNIIISQYTDFDDLDFEIENPTKYNKVRFLWVTLPETKTRENQKKIDEYIKSKYNVVLIKHKNQFIDNVNIGDVIESDELNTINDRETQQTIFKNYLSGRGVDDNIINEVIKLDENITKQMVFNNDSGGSWDIIRFGGENFMSYEKIDIDWRNLNGLFQIAGKNAEGKTTIYKLLSYLLYGKTLETETRIKFGDSRYVNNRNNAKFCRAYGVILANNQYFGIERITKLNYSRDGVINGAPTTTSYYLLNSPDDKMDDSNNIDKLDDTTKNKTQELINELIGSYDNFNRITLTTSDTLNKVLSNEMAVFIDSLLFDSGLDIFDKKLETVKEYNKKRIKNINRVVCNEDVVKSNILNDKKMIDEHQNNINEINNIIPDINKRINIGAEYIETLLKKLYTIDENIYNLDVENTKKEINKHFDIIKQHEEKINIINDTINKLPKTYDSERLNELTLLLDKNKEEINSVKYKNREIENKINNEKHQIEILNGKIFVNNKEFEKEKQNIDKLKTSKICPVCNQPLKDDEQKHINKLIDESKLRISELISENNKIQSENIVIHDNNILDLKSEIIENDKKIQKLTLSIEPILSEIGKINNDKNDVERRKTLQLEEANHKIKVGDLNNKIKDLNELIKNHELSLFQIEKNKKINEGIILAKEKLNNLNNELNQNKQLITTKKSNIDYLTLKIKDNEELLKKYKIQEHEDYIISLYSECVHRDGIPKLMLKNYIIPQINKSLNNIFKNLKFNIWIDLNDLKPKLVYYDRPDAIIDCISSSGMERTFSSIALKFALNQINIKSKPLFLLMDEIMGKLVDESVDEFNNILESLKEYVNRIIIIEHNNTINADHVFYVSTDNNGISKIKLNEN